MSINVLFLHRNGNWMRGSENAALALLRRIDRRKITPYLICGNPIFVEMARSVGVAAFPHFMPEVMIDGSDVRLQVFSWFTTVRYLASFVRRHDIHLIYCNGGSTVQTGYYAGRYMGIPVISHLHSPYNRRYALLYRFHLVDRVIFVSKAVEKSITAKQKFRAHREVIYNGVDTTRFCPLPVRDPSWRERFNVPPDAVVFGQVSSLITRKGTDILLRAFKLVRQRHADARLLIVGDGPERANFVALAAQLGVESSVDFVGDQSDPLPFYQHIIDINVLASRSDAFPLSILEAASCGIPTVGSAVDGVPEGVLDGRTGLLFPSENVKVLAEKMSMLLLDASLQHSLGESARKDVLSRFSIEVYVSSIERIILEEVIRNTEQKWLQGQVSAGSQGVPGLRGNR